jgi:TIR domain
VGGSSVGGALCTSKLAELRGVSYRQPEVGREVFISYRRDDASSESGRLADAIRNHFNEDSVFMDTSDTRLGEEWPEALQGALQNASVVLVVIGPEWLFARDEYGRRRIDDPNDWVRQEIQFGLEHGKTIMPLLVRHARMVPAVALPQEIGSLSSRQARNISAENWTHDVQLVLRELEPHLGRRPAAAPPQSAPEEKTATFTADDFRTVTLGFDSAEMAVRNATADDIKEIAAFLELDEVLAFCRSRKRAERVGAAIALGVHIRSSKRARTDRRVLSALGELLNGQSSLVRYRAAQVIRSSPALVPNYEDDLRRLAEIDENPQVREIAAAALG